MIEDDNEYSLARRQHIRYLLRYLEILPHRLANQDTSRLTIAFFAISGLDVLNALDELSSENKQRAIDWIYRLQVLPNTSGSIQSNLVFIIF